VCTRPWEVDNIDARSWHLAPPTARTAAVPPDADDNTSAQQVEAGAAPLRPLWLRVLTGESLAWRVRAVRRWVVRLRRRHARDGLRWLQLHVRVRALLEQGRPLAALRAAREVATTPDAVRWPAVRLPVSVCGVDRAHPLVRHVEPVASDAPAVALVGPGCAHASTTHAGPVVGVGVAPPGASVVVGGRGPVGAARWLPEAIDPAIRNPTELNQRRPVRDMTMHGWQLAEQAHDRFRWLQHARSVTCIFGADDDQRAVAGGIVALAAYGVPLVATEVPQPVAGIVGDDLAALVVSATAADMDDDRTRELHSVRLRRAAVRAHGPAARWRQIAAATGITQPLSPSLSVVMATKRPDHVLTAAAQVAEQRGDRPQLVLGLHNAAMPAGIERQVRARYQGDVVLRTFDEQMNLGEVLDALIRTADGDLVSKWDDDDWYAADHLDDMRWALQFSGGTLVGKAAEFVYLEQLDVTIRRHAYGAETFSTTVAGGTLTIARADLLAMDGWPSAVRRADRQLISRVQDRGGQVYRTHGFGYVLRRAGSQRPDEHTWRIGDDYFIHAATDQSRGLDLTFAGFDAPDRQTSASDVTANTARPQPSTP
jgi:hypothetical protein